MLLIHFIRTTARQIFHGSFMVHIETIQMCKLSPTSLLLRDLPRFPSYSQQNFKELVSLLGVLKNLLPTPLNPKSYFLMMCMYIVDFIWSTPLILKWKNIS
jgi:hypothetical protein